MIRWMLFSTLAAGVFYGLYLLLLRNDRQLQLRRCYLMATLAFSLLLPLIKMPDISLQLVDTQPIEMWGAASGAEVVVGAYEGEAPADAARHVPTIMPANICSHYPQSSWRCPEIRLPFGIFRR